MAIDISAVIITKNEIDRIEECIQSILPLTDDIIVIDSGSTDGTKEKATKLGAKVFDVEWQGFGPTKNYGHSKTKFDWIISIDADESLTKELILELNKIDLQSGCVYMMDRQNFYLGKRIRYSGWNPDWVSRIFNKNDVKWNDNLVHERLIIPAESKIIKLRHKLIHTSYRSIEDHMAKVEKYAALRAQIWMDAGKYPGFLKRWFGPTYKAFKSYFIKLGLLDGREGWIIAKMHAHLVKRQIFHFDKIKNSKS